MNDYEKRRLKIQTIQTCLQAMQIIVTMGIPFVMYYINKMMK